MADTVWNFVAKAIKDGRFGNRSVP